MGIRRLEELTAIPPVGAITLAVGRHLTEGYMTPEMLRAHRDRARLIHAMVDDMSLDVLSWGTTDREDPPNEIVDVIVAVLPSLIAGIAAVLASWIGSPRAKSAPDDAEPRTVLGIAIRRSDGEQRTWTYRGPLGEDALRESIEAFLASRPEG
jgi:hypothetical protein